MADSPTPAPGSDPGSVSPDDCLPADRGRDEGCRGDCSRQEYGAGGHAGEPGAASEGACAEGGAAGRGGEPRTGSRHTHGDEAPGERAASKRALTGRSLLVAVVLLIGANLWMVVAELVTLSVQVTMSTPPIPALMGLLVLLAVRPLGGVLRLTRRELLFVYAFLTLSVALTSGGGLREFMPETTVLTYFATPENGWDEHTRYQPAWLVPKDPEVIRGFYESSASGVPWAAWLGPLAGWSLLFVLLLGTLLCLAVLLYDEWAEREKLSFPIAELALAVTHPGDPRRRIPAFWRDPVMWGGFGLAALHNGLNILHAFNPAIPALGFTHSFSDVFTERPWTVLGEQVLYYRPEVLGFSYLMPQDVVVSSLVFYVLLLLEGMGALMLGYDIPRFPHLESQAGGSFICLALILLYSARRPLSEAFKGALAGERGLKSLAAWGLSGGVVGMYVWARAAGMAPLTIIVYFGLLLIIALSYARLRAQSGLPEKWGFPVTQAHQMVYSAVGSLPYRQAGGVGNLTIYHTCWFLTRGYLPQLSAYHFESLHLAREGGVSRREMIITLLLALVIGMIVSYAAQLQAAYTYGMSFLEGGTHGGGMRVADARHGFNVMREAATTGVRPIPTETGATIWGAAITLLLTLLRHRYARFPLNHLGFVIGTTRGYRVWGGLAGAALIKSLAVRLGGVSLYRRLIPGAIGLILGHFVIAGGVWSFAAAFGGEAFRSYQVWFG